MAQETVKINVFVKMWRNRIISEYDGGEAGVLRFLNENNIEPDNCKIIFMNLSYGQRWMIFYKINE